MGLEYRGAHLLRLGIGAELLGEEVLASLILSVSVKDFLDQDFLSLI